MDLARRVDLVLRRLVECLGRDRTRHQVAEVTSLGLVQMTRKRIGTGLLEAFSESCEHCGGRGLVLHHEPVESRKKQDDEPRRNRRGGRSRGHDDADSHGNGLPTPSPKDVAAMARAADQQAPQPSDQPADQTGQTDQRADQRVDRADQRVDRADRAEQPAGRDDRHDDQHAGAEQAGEHAAGNAEPTDTEPRDARPSRRQRGSRRSQPVLADEADAGMTDVDAGEPTVVDEPVAAEVATDHGDGTPEPTPRKRTTTRKRAARRVQGPAGEPTVVITGDSDRAATAPDATAPVATAPAATGRAATGTASDASASAAAAPGSAEAPSTQAPASAADSSGTVPVSTAPPKVVATVRRRGAARRPAGPPTGSSVHAGTATATTVPPTATAPPTADGGPAAGSDAGAAGTASSELPSDVQEPTAPAHVPVKKKGVRKR